MLPSYNHGDTEPGKSEKVNTEMPEDI